MMRASLLLGLVALTGACGTNAASSTVAHDGGASHDASTKHDAGDASNMPDVYVLPPTWTGSAPKVVGSGIEGIALALDDSNVYLQGTGGAIYGCPVTGCPGGNPTLLSALIGGNADLTTLVARSGVARFLSDQGLSISSVAFASPEKTSTVYTTPGSNGISALVSDGMNLYFGSTVVADGGEGDGFALSSCPLGGACDAPSVLYETSSDEFAVVGALGVSNTELFFVENASTTSLRAVSTSGGGTPRTVCSPEQIQGAISIVVAGGYAYFTTSYDSSSIYQCATSGTAEAVVFIHDYAPYALATDGTNLYWTNYAPGTGTVATCPVGATCTAPLTVASMQDAPFAIAANATSVYWTTSSAVVRADR